ncbi:hypothetical protein ACFQAT_07780 [Undibacterium arcticum]|uniref:hypothetical protein n=1 Tax=Undibacterium arcticum TaxID=1762892 RepID=UPI003621A8CE
MEIALIKNLGPIEFQQYNLFSFLFKTGTRIEKRFNALRRELVTADHSAPGLHG